MHGASLVSAQKMSDSSIRDVQQSPISRPASLALWPQPSPPHSPHSSAQQTPFASTPTVPSLQVSPADVSNRTRTEQSLLGRRKSVQGYVQVMFQKRSRFDRSIFATYRYHMPRRHVIIALLSTAQVTSSSRETAISCRSLLWR